MINIYKASAGSGKTFTLAKQYITLLLKADNNQAFRHILAVTFTNKATDEMKSRILLELHILATNPKKSPYLADLISDTSLDEQSLQKKASAILSNILHDYSVFSISTIDRFFQQTLKAFTREIGQFASYQIELNKDGLIEETVDRVLDNLTSNDDNKLNWLTDNTLAQIEEGGGYKLDYTLKNVAKRLKSEEHRVLFEEKQLGWDEIYTPKALQSLADDCKKIKDDYISDFKKAKLAMVNALENVGIYPSETKTSFLEKNIKKYSDLGDYIENLSDTVRDYFTTNDFTTWFKKADADKAVLIGPVQEKAIRDYYVLFGERLRIYNTANLLESQIYGFGIINNLHEEFNNLLKEKNVLSLDDSNTILKNIIDGTETPFIYEKTGIRYDHFLLDEFQDTSRVQWDNFYPLLHNSVSENNYNLIVGDVKQSIYRWRNSDWKLLRDEVTNSFNPGQVKTHTLDKNWRSMENIIKFNNDFFSLAAKYLDDLYQLNSTEIQDIYSDVRQKVGKTQDSKGQVICSFYNKEAEVQAVLKAIIEAKNRKYDFGDIAILVRARQEGEAIAAYLMSKGIKVVTDDSLLISSSLVVRRLVALLSRKDNADDKLTQYLAEELLVELPESYHSLVDLCEELLRSLKDSSKEVFESEVLYIQSFMDKLREFVTKSGNDLHGFLKYWETNEDKIASPSAGDAVTIMTIHKAKGLDFPYVIIPFLEKVEFQRPSQKWSKPSVENTPLENSANGIYDVLLSKKSEETLFADNYKKETLMQFVDNLNIVYVAFTRAEEVVHVIAELPKSKSGKISNFAQLLYDYVKSVFESEVISDEKGDEEEILEFEEYVLGDSFEHKVNTDTVDNNAPEPYPAEFCSWKLDKRLRTKPESIDFFTSQEDIEDSSQSSLVKGILLHDILAKVNSRDDLNYAVEGAVMSGSLEEDKAEYVKEHLSALIDSQASWFGDVVKDSYNEATIIGLNGEIARPDRVVIKGDEVVIIDYKTGAHSKEYERQVQKYAKLYEDMGYKNVRKYLWYIQTGKLQEVF